MLDEVLIACSTTLHTYAATVLCAVLGKWSTLDVAHIGESEYAGLFGNKVLISFICKEFFAGRSAVVGDRIQINKGICICYSFTESAFAMFVIAGFLITCSSAGII